MYEKKPTITPSKVPSPPPRPPKKKGKGGLIFFVGGEGKEKDKKQSQTNGCEGNKAHKSLQGKLKTWRSTPSGKKEYGKSNTEVWR